MTQEAQLKACPFCGGDAHIYTPPISIGDDITDVDWMRAQCSECGALRGFARFSNHNRKSADFKRARAEVIAAWNTRIESGVVAELASCLRDCVDVMGPLAKEPNVNPWLVEASALLAKLEASK